MNQYYFNYIPKAVIVCVFEFTALQRSKKLEICTSKSSKLSCFHKKKLQMRREIDIYSSIVCMVLSCVDNMYKG